MIRKHVIVVAVVVLLVGLALFFFPSTTKKVESPQQNVPAPAAPTQPAPAQDSPEPAPLQDAQPKAVGRTARSGEEWRREFFSSRDYFEFVSAAAAAALRGDGRAAYYVRQAISNCAAVLALYKRKADEPEFDPKQGYAEFLNRNATLPASERDELIDRYGRCERFAAENAFAGLPIKKEDAYLYTYWERLAAEQNDPLAAADTIGLERMQLSHLQNSEKRDAQDRIRNASQIALRSKDPQALFALGFGSANLFVRSNSSDSSGSKGLGLALAACEMGADCSFDHMGMKMSYRGTSMTDNSHLSFAEVMQSAVGLERYARAYQDAQEIKELLAREDWIALETQLGISK
jgi:hypothetical protein